MWIKIITINRTKDLNYFRLCAFNLFNKFLGFVFLPVVLVMDSISHHAVFSLVSTWFSCLPFPVGPRFAIFCVSCWLFLGYIMCFGRISLWIIIKVPWTAFGPAACCILVFIHNITNVKMQIVRIYIPFIVINNMKCIKHYVPVSQTRLRQGRGNRGCWGCCSTPCFFLWATVNCCE